MPKIDPDSPRGAALRLALSFYVGETCPLCGVQFTSIESLDEAVRFPNDRGRIAHRACYRRLENPVAVAQESAE